MRGLVSAAKAGIEADTSLATRLSHEEEKHNSTQESAASLSAAVASLEVESEIRFDTVADSIGNVQTAVSSIANEHANTIEDLGTVSDTLNSISTASISQTAHLASLEADKVSNDQVTFRSVSRSPCVSCLLFRDGTPSKFLPHNQGAFLDCADVLLILNNPFRVASVLLITFIPLCGGPCCLTLAFLVTCIHGTLLFLPHVRT